MPKQCRKLGASGGRDAAVHDPPQVPPGRPRCGDAPTGPPGRTGRTEKTAPGRGFGGDLTLEVCVGLASILTRRGPDAVWTSRPAGRPRHGNGGPLRHHKEKSYRLRAFLKPAASSRNVCSGVCSGRVAGGVSIGSETRADSPVKREQSAERRPRTERRCLETLASGRRDPRTRN